MLPLTPVLAAVRGFGRDPASVSSAAKSNCNIAGKPQTNTAHFTATCHAAGKSARLFSDPGVVRLSFCSR